MGLHRGLLEGLLYKRDSRSLDNGSFNMGEKPWHGQ